jgi:hypothetical protein
VVVGIGIGVCFLVDGRRVVDFDCRASIFLYQELSVMLSSSGALVLLILLSEGLVVWYLYIYFFL